MKRLRGNLTFANTIGVIALFVALGGSAYAATQLPKNSVGTKQLRKEAVTPIKLSKASKAALTGKEGPKGERGERGPEGSSGPQGPAGPKGIAGTTGVEPLVVDAESGEVASPAGGVALSGATSWTTTGMGQAGFLFGEVTATAAISQEAAEEFFFNCFVTVTVFDNGVQVAQVSPAFTERTLEEKKTKIGPIGIAFHEPGTHTITATASTYKCDAGTKINDLELAVAPVG